MHREVQVRFRERIVETYALKAQGAAFLLYYLCPDEYERTLVKALEEENKLRSLCKVIRTSSGDRKIPLVASHGTASWVDEEGTIPESDDSFGLISLGAHKVASIIKVSDELLQDSVFDVESYQKRKIKELSMFLYGMCSVFIERRMEDKAMSRNYRRNAAYRKLLAKLENELMTSGKNHR